jgi:predicted DNA-binding transcriptional regulator YafY
MLATSARLLRLLSVLQARRFWTGQDLAERLEIEPRTLRRDVDRLRSLGYTIDSTSGPGGGYQLGTGATLPPVLFEDDEAVAIAVALQGAAQSLAGFDEVALRTLVKLLQILPARLRPRVEALRHATIALSGGVKGPPANLLAELAAACRELHTLSFEYRKPRGAETEKRSAEPVRLVSTGSGRWYLLAWDLERGDFRTFRVDRIVGEPVRGQPFARREPPADITRYLREPLDDTHCLLTFGADSEDALVGHLLLTGADFEVLEPRELKASMRRLIRRLERAAASHEKVRELRVAENS